jgi:hypothetical protein
MYIYDHQLTGPEPKPITSGPEFQAEMEEYKKLKERHEALRKEHKKRLAPPPLDHFPIDVFKRARVTVWISGGKGAKYLKTSFAAEITRIQADAKARYGDQFDQP